MFRRLSGRTGGGSHIRILPCGMNGKQRCFTFTFKSPDWRNWHYTAAVVVVANIVEWVLSGVSVMVTSYELTGNRIVISRCTSQHPRSQRTRRFRFSVTWISIFFCHRCQDELWRNIQYSSHVVTSIIMLASSFAHHRNSMSSSLSLAANKLHCASN